MCDALYELFADQLVQNRNEGLKEGRKEGLSQGINQAMDLIRKLIADNRTSDIERVASDSAYRQLLLNEYHL